MDLKIKDVAELLNVSALTIQNWVEKSLIPAYQIDGQLRFSRSEIESWVLKHQLKTEDGTSPFSIEKTPKENLSKSPITGSQKFSLYRTLHKGQVLPTIQETQKEEVIRAYTRYIAKTHKIDSDMLADMLIDRERLQSTALNNGMAIPHTRDFLLSSAYDVVFFVFLERPIAYDSLDGEPVHTLIFLFACNDKRHLHLLAKIAHFSSQNSIRAMLQRRPNKEQLLEFIEQWEGAISSPSEK